MTNSTPVIDVHTHIIVPEVEAIVAGMPGLDAQRALDFRRNGAASSAVSREMVGARMQKLTSVEPRLADMDSQGVDVQLISISPSQYHYWADPELALTVCSAANRGVAAFVAEEPTRFIGLGLVPLQHPDLMIRALDDAVLTCGLLGVEISSHSPDPSGVGTLELSDPRYEPFWARAQELDALIFLHPFGCTLDERLDRFYLANTVGQPVENATALSHLIFSGVLDRYPSLRILAAHGGGYLPTFLGRSDHAWEVRPEARDCINKPSTYLRRLWFDSLVHTPEALAALVAAAGADRVALGSDYPFDMGVQDPVDRVRATELSDEDTAAILTGTAALLGLSPTASEIPESPAPLKES